MSKRTIATVVLTTVALTAGGFGTANAATKSTRTVVTKSVTKVSQPGVNARSLGGPAAALDGILSGLVTKGTITQVQADAIQAAVLSAAETAKANRPAKVGGPDRAALDALISSTLGISSATIKSRLLAGETLAAIAGDKKDALIAAMIAEINKQIDAALAAGKITTTQASAQKAKTTERVTNMVNKVKEFGKKGHGKGQRASTISFKAA